MQLSLLIYFMCVTSTVVIAGLVYLRIGITIARLGARPTQLAKSPASEQAKRASIDKPQSLLVVPPRVENRDRSSVESLQITRQEEVLLHKRRRIQLLALIVSLHPLCWTGTVLLKC